MYIVSDTPSSVSALRLTHHFEDEDEGSPRYSDNVKKMDQFCRTVSATRPVSDWCARGGKQLGWADGTYVGHG